MNTKTRKHAPCTTTQLWLFWSCSGQRPWFRPQDSAVWQRYPAASQQQWHVKHDLSHISKSLIPVSKLLFWALLVIFKHPPPVLDLVVVQVLGLPLQQLQQRQARLWRRLAGAVRGSVSTLSVFCRLATIMLELTNINWRTDLAITHSCTYF